MARHQKRNQPVSEEEYDEMEEKIHAHFDRVREALEEAREHSDDE